MMDEALLMSATGPNPGAYVNLVPGLFNELTEFEAVVKRANDYLALPEKLVVIQEMIVKCFEASGCQLELISNLD
jgi:hypothetical protein